MDSLYVYCCALNILLNISVMLNIYIKICINMKMQMQARKLLPNDTVYSVVNQFFMNWFICMNTNEPVQ